VPSRCSTAIITQAVLEEGDEVTVGRTKLRFSWDAPRGAGVVAPAAPPAGAKKVARLQTTYMGAVESRERFERKSRQRIGRSAVLAIVAAAVVSALVLGYARGTLPHVTVGTARGARAVAPKH
jgi:hypothetical protein